MKKRKNCVKDYVKKNAVIEATKALYPCTRVDVALEVGRPFGNKLFGMGQTECSPRDRFNYKTGYRIAKGRVVTCIVNQILRQRDLLEYLGL